MHPAKQRSWPTRAEPVRLYFEQAQRTLEAIKVANVILPLNGLHTDD
jgi:hypothetical protein